jgi:hypothetical protein
MSQPRFATFIIATMVIVGLLLVHPKPGLAQNLNEKYKSLGWSCSSISLGMPLYDACVPCQDSGMDFFRDSDTTGHCVPKAGKPSQILEEPPIPPVIDAPLPPVPDLPIPKNPFRQGQSSSGPINPFRSDKERYLGTLVVVNQGAVAQPEEKGKQDCPIYGPPGPWIQFATPPGSNAAVARLEWRQDYKRAFDDCINSISVRLVNMTISVTAQAQLEKCRVSGHPASTTVSAKPGSSRIELLTTLKGIGDALLESCIISWELGTASPTQK